MLACATLPLPGTSGPVGEKQLGWPIERRVHVVVERSVARTVRLREVRAPVGARPVGIREAVLVRERPLREHLARLRLYMRVRCQRDDGAPNIER